MHRSAPRRAGPRHGPTPEHDRFALAPIPGTTKQRRLQENVGAADVALTPDDLAAIDRLLAGNPVEGERYTPMHMRLVGR